jgi:hypothetical protein
MTFTLFWVLLPCNFVSRCRRKWQSWKVKVLHRVRGRKVEGVGQSETRDGVKGSGQYEVSNQVRERMDRMQREKRRNGPFTGPSGGCYVHGDSLRPFPQVTNERHPWPSQGDVILPVETVGMPLDLYHFPSCLSGVVVSVLATGPKGRMFEPGQDDWFLRAHLPSDGK